MRFPSKNEPHFLNFLYRTLQSRLIISDMPSLRYVLVFTGYEFATMPVYKKLLKYAVSILEELFVSHHPASISANRVVHFVLLWVSWGYEVLEFCDVCGIRNLSYCYTVSAAGGCRAVIADCQVFSMHINFHIITSIPLTADYFLN